jgi:argininosuccinate lyase
VSRPDTPPQDLGSGPTAERGAKKSGAGPFWQARTGSGLHPDLLAFSQSIEEDRPFFVHDIAGSSAHVLGLAKAELLTASEAKLLLHGLRRALAEHEAGRFGTDVELEDMHMNLEARLIAELHDTGRKLHTGRSRNDQVATCIVLYCRENLAQLAQGLHSLAAALASQARANLRTPWISRTHGQPAQPATIGFLLAAHAHRILDMERKTLRTFDQVGESPLGSGAVAGTTLPLDAAYTAAIMGLRPPRSALLGTGTRDTIVETCMLAQQVGLVLASLCQDLLDLYGTGALKLPAGYTSGSSLMPQKRNPDALELARGRGKGLAGPNAAVTSIMSGLGLGYMRDFQLTKPWLVQAMDDANSTVALLGPMIEGATFDMRALLADYTKPGIVATDVAEALVRKGMPFRTAYGVVAKAFSLVETGMSFSDAIAQQNLPLDQLDAALSAMQPDPGRRASFGGPAPKRVSESLDAFDDAARTLAGQLEKAQADAEKPFLLLTQPIERLVN